MKLLVLLSEQSPELEEYLFSQDCTYDKVHTYQNASENLALYEYDCVLLEIENHTDLVFELLKKNAEANKAEGIIVLSKNSSLENKLGVLDAGADDFLTIPFHQEELLARIKAVIRRKRFNTQNKLYLGNLVIDFQAKTTKVWDKDLNLTKKEYEILLFFIANKNRVLSKTILAEYLWGDNTDNMDSFNLLFTHIKNLRKKLQSYKAELEIKNVYGVGYQIIEL